MRITWGKAVDVRWSEADSCVAVAGEGMLIVEK